LRLWWRNLWHEMIPKRPSKWRSCNRPLIAFVTYFLACLRGQAPDVHWTYGVRGVVPAYKAPSSATKCDAVCVGRRHNRTSVNFLRDNMRLVTTAASSPLKGRRLVQSASRRDDDSCWNLRHINHTTASSSRDKFNDENFERKNLFRRQFVRRIAGLTLFGDGFSMLICLQHNRHVTVTLISKTGWIFSFCASLSTYPQLGQFPSRF